MLSMLVAITTTPVFAAQISEGKSSLTSATPKIDLDEIDILMAPLTVEKLQVEADGWLKLIKASAHRVADTKVRIRVLGQNKNDSESVQKDIENKKTAAMK